MKYYEIHIEEKEEESFKGHFHSLNSINIYIILIIMNKWSK